MVAYLLFRLTWLEDFIIKLAFGFLEPLPMVSKAVGSLGLARRPREAQLFRPYVTSSSLWAIHERGYLQAACSAKVGSRELFVRARAGEHLGIAGETFLGFESGDLHQKDLASSSESHAPISSPLQSVVCAWSCSADVSSLLWCLLSVGTREFFCIGRDENSCLVFAVVSEASINKEILVLIGSSEKPH